MNKEDFLNKKYFALKEYAQIKDVFLDGECIYFYGDNGNKFKYQWENSLYNMFYLKNYPFYAFSYHLNGKPTQFSLSLDREDELTLFVNVSESKRQITFGFYTYSELTTEDKEILRQMHGTMLQFLRTKSPYRLQMMTKVYSIFVNHSLMEVL